MESNLGFMGGKSAVICGFAGIALVALQPCNENCFTSISIARFVSKWCSIINVKRLQT